jgi:hypothetical protein
MPRRLNAPDQKFTTTILQLALYHLNRWLSRSTCRRSFDGSESSYKPRERSSKANDKIEQDLTRRID